MALHDLYELVVFTAEDGSFGNPLGIVPDADRITDDEAQAIARELGYSETVFIANDRSRIRIYTPAVRLPFAGHPTVGTCWFLAREGFDGREITVDAGVISLEPGDNTCTIEARPEWSPVRSVRQLGSAAEVDAMASEPNGRSVYLWAWIDEEAGIVRSRCFVFDLGVSEDEATGSAAIYLAGTLGRALEIHQGRGSRIYVEPTDSGTVRLSGRVREVRRGSVAVGDRPVITWE